MFDQFIIKENENIENKFSIMAEYLLCNSVMVVSKTEIYFNDIEFYLYSNNHPDPFVHRHEKQKKFQSLYFHESGFGVDITFGNQIYYLSVLLRGISVNGRNIDGPFKSKLKLLNCIETIFDSENRFHIEKDNTRGNCKIEKKIRQNLWMPSFVNYDMKQNIKSDEENSFFESIYIVSDNGFKRLNINKTNNKEMINKIQYFKDYSEQKYRFCIIDGT